MKFVETQRTIPTPPADVWRVLTNAKRLASGPFGITRLDGEITPGGKIKLWSEVSPNRAFALRVRVLEENERMVWEGGMPFGLFKGVRTFSLAADGTGTRFHMREEFSGPMLGMIWKSMPDLQPSFEQFAAALADASVESQASA